MIPTSAALLSDRPVFPAWESLAQVGSPKLSAAIQKILAEPRDSSKTKKDVNDMRNLMLNEQVKLGQWDIKRAKGGLVEIEFIAQYLQLVAGDANVLNPNTKRALLNIGQKELLPPDQAAKLLAACELYQRLTQILRLCVAEQYKPESSPKSLNEAVARAAEMPDMAATELLLADTQTQVSAIFSDIIGR